MISYSSRSLGRGKGSSSGAASPSRTRSWFDRLHLCSHSGDLLASHLAGHPRLRNLRAGPETGFRPQLSPF